jgi:NAD(P)-dependent dehydrogenase (short-subunit alcohol dehydrogenase family)
MLAIQEALKHFPPEGGSIVNISSIASQSPVPSSSLYSATKAALDAMTAALAKELGPRNIRVNTVAPGYTDTEGNQKAGFVGSAVAEALGRGHAARRQVWPAGGDRACGGVPGLVASVRCYVGKSFRDSTISAKVQQMAQWLIIVSWVAVISGLLTALAIAFDVTAHP